MEEYEGFTKYRSYVLQLVQEPIGDAVEAKELNSEFTMEQTEPKFKLFNGFSEIAGIIDTLNLIETFISIDPPVEEGVNSSNYLNYHVHNYFQEMYILKERLNAYLTLIQRLSKKRINKKLLDEAIALLFTMIHGSLDNIAGHKGVRNKHVHQKKYSDDEMRWLASTSFLSEFHDEFTRESESAYGIAKGKWITIIGKNNVELKTLIDVYFGMCYEIVTQLDNVN